MIDYNKLNEAHQLAEKYTEANKESCTITQTYYGSSKDDYYKLNTYSYDEFYFDNLDDLITKLKELTQPQPKFKIGDDLWFTFHEQVINGRIKQIDKDAYGQYTYNLDNYWIKEKQLHVTRQELIQSNIDYWTNLKENNWLKEIDEECQHESDGYLHGELAMKKCKKCGDYYR